MSPNTDTIYPVLVTVQTLQDIGAKQTDITAPAIVYRRGSINANDVSLNIQASLFPKTLRLRHARLPMAGTKRAAPSRSSSPGPGSNKRARIDHNDETKAQDGQEKKVEEVQEEEPKDLKEYHEEARELRVKEKLSLDEEMGMNKEPTVQATHIINQSEPGVTAHNSRDQSSGFPRERNDENLPQTHLKLQEAAKKDEESRVEDGVVIDRLEAADSAPKSHDQSSISSSKVGANKRARLELKVEIETEEKLMVHNETTAATTASASDIVADDLSYDSSAPNEKAQETIMASVELDPVELASKPSASTPANSSTDALESTDQDHIGIADSDIGGTNAQQLPVSRARSPRSPTPSLDPRISLWMDERRSFAGQITIDRDKARAAHTAHMASQAPLFINGVPQLKIFGDGSIKGRRSSSRPEEGWRPGGYRVAFRNPFDDTVRFVSRDQNPARFLAHPSVMAYQQGVDNDYVLEEEGEIYDGPSRVVDFTILCFGTKKAFCVPQLELAAVSQCLEAAIRLNDEHQPPTSVVTIFSDSTSAINRIKRGFIICPEGRTLSLWNNLSNPLVQTIIWQSHYLRDRGCQVELVWNPRCTSLGPSIADAAATAWKKWPESEETKWSQRDLPLDVRDGIMDKLNDATNELIRAYEV